MVLGGWSLAFEPTVLEGRGHRHDVERAPSKRDCMCLSTAFHVAVTLTKGRVAGGTLAAMAVVKPFRAARYDEEVAGPLDQLVAPPYDVIDDATRGELMARSPLNVVHLTLPDDEADAERLWAEWQSDGVIVWEDAPSFWALEQDYVGPDGVARTRRGLFASLHPEPYKNRVVLPHERTHAGPKEGRLRLLRATGVHFEPIFLLYDGELPFTFPTGPPDIETEGAKLWRIAPDGIEEAFAD
jgi:hypothetical protein